MRRDFRRIGALAGALALYAAVAGAAAEKTANPADAIAERFANADQPKPAVAAEPPIPERPSLDYEMDMLRRARAEADAGKTSTAPKPTAITVESEAAQTAKPEPEETDPSPPTQVNSPTPAVATTATSPKSEPPPSLSPAAAPVAAAPAAQKPAMDEPAAPTSTEPTATAKAEPAIEKVDAPRVSAAAGAKATILLVLEGRQKGPPDPILCIADSCFVSAGLTAAARSMPRADALALKNTQNATSDTCLGKSACAFRDIALPDDAVLEVISLGSGDYPKPGEGFTAALDATCKMNDGDLECAQPLATLHFTAWVVPEATAKSAGAAALESAVADGLPFADDIQSADK
ncbi:MAG: hypothetical protein ACT4OU_00205 [Hyphomicrobium sp.]